MYDLNCFSLASLREELSFNPFTKKLMRRAINPAILTTTSFVKDRTEVFNWYFYLLG